jgi:anti-sigma B factor antagonist
MTSPRLGLSAYTIGDAYVVAPVGEVDVAAAPALGRMLGDAVREGHVDLVVDLSGVTFMDSSGLSVLLNASRRTIRAGGRLRLASPNADIQRVMTLTRLDTTFPIYPSLAAALGDD